MGAVFCCQLVTASVTTATAVVSLCHAATATAVVRGEERAAAVAAEEKKDDNDYPGIVVTAHNMLPPLKFGVHHIICEHEKMCYRIFPKIMSTII